MCMESGKLIFGLVITMLFCSSIFAVALYEQTCSDGTAYMKCSSAQPGYMCVPSGSTLVLENVIGQTYPSDYPISSKAGKLTENAVACACENYAGYVEKNGECVSATQQSDSMTDNSQSNTDYNTQTNSQTLNQTNNTTNQSKSADSKQNNANGATSKTDSNSKLTITQKWQQEEQTPIGGFDTTTWIIIAIVALVVLVGAVVFVGAIIVVAYLLYKKYKKKNSGL